MSDLKEAWQHFTEIGFGVHVSDRREKLMKQIIEDAPRPILNVGSNRIAFDCDVTLDHVTLKGLSVVGDARYLPFRDKCFPTVVCCEVLEHIANWKDAVEELKRICSGKIHITTPYNLFPVCQFMKKAEDRIYLDGTIDIKEMAKILHITEMNIFETWRIYVCGNA